MGESSGEIRNNDILDFCASSSALLARTVGFPNDHGQTLFLEILPKTVDIRLVSCEIL
jgi:hypothetical protein